MDNFVMAYRLCPHNVKACECSDAAMQPCLSAVIAKYLKALSYATWKNVMPEKSAACVVHKNEVEMITKTFPTMADLKHWIETGHSG